MPSSLSQTLCCIRRDLRKIERTLSDEGYDIEPASGSGGHFEASYQSQICCIGERLATIMDALELSGTSVTKWPQSLQAQLCCIRKRVGEVEDVIAAGLGYYIDSVNGDDANSGRGISQAVQTPTRLMEITDGGNIAGKKVKVARGSYFTEQLTTTGDDAIIESYGDEEDDPPVWDAGDSILNASFTKTGGQTNVYQATIALPSDPEATGNVTVGPLPLPTMLTAVASIAACDALPGSFYCASWFGSSATLYVHSTGSTDPTADGKLYRYTARSFGMYHTGDRLKLSNQTARLNLNKGGAVKTNGQYAEWDYVRCEQGNRHTGYTKMWSTLRNCTMIEARNDLEGAGTAGSFVANENDVSGKDYTTEDSEFNGGATPFFTGPLQHGAVDTVLARTVTHRRPKCINCFTCFTILAETTDIIDPVFTTCATGAAMGQPGYVVNISGGTGSINRLTHPAAGGTINSTGNTLSVPAIGVGFYRLDATSLDVALNINGDTLTLADSANTSNNRLIHHKQGPVSVQDIEILPTMCNSLDTAMVAGFSGGTATYTGAGNIWYFGVGFTLNGTAYTSLADFKLAGYDLTSTVHALPIPVATDNFNRADENLEDSPNWTLVGGTAAQLAVRSNQLAVISITSSSYYRRAIMASVNHWIAFVVGQAPASAGAYVAFRAIDVNNWLGVRCTNTAFQVGRNIAGTLTVSVVGSSALTPAVGQTVICGIVGDKVWLWVIPTGGLANIEAARTLIRGQAVTAPSLAAATGTGVIGRGPLLNPFIDDFACGIVA